MNFNKSLLVTFILSIFFISINANAGLQTKNYTNEDSSVRVTSGIIKPCSSQAGVYTPKKDKNGKPGVSYVGNTEIIILCATSKHDICTANIYKTNNCSGHKIGRASLNLKTKTIINAAPTNPLYVFLVENNGTLLKIKYNK
ncbi:hypothetical protein N9L02_00950 [Gammaproteobacteria bacterium]|nr:hypothetical protein [Gammaproteobacteria bacterium]